MSLTAVLRRMKRTDITVHGFRSTFRDWCAESTNFPRKVCEHALAHQDCGGYGDADTAQAVGEITNCAGSQAATNTDTRPAA